MKAQPSATEFAPLYPTLELTVRGMDCASCARNVEAALSALPGVQHVQVFLSTEKAKVAFDPERVTVETLAKAVEEAGYKVEIPFDKVLAKDDITAKNHSVAVLGDLTDLRRSARAGMKGKKTSQKINQMADDRLGSQQVYKNLMRGIRTAFLTEKHTSSTCYACGHHHPASRRHRGHWECERCGFSLQADLNGAGNLLKRRLTGARIDLPAPVPVRVIRHWRWDGRHNRICARIVKGRGISPAPDVVRTPVTVPSVGKNPTM